MKVRAATPAECKQIARGVGCAPTEDFAGIVAVDRNGLVAGGIGFDQWTENSVQGHMWVPSPMVWRSLLRPAFSYVFEECDKGLFLGIIPSHRWRACRLVQRLGFVELHRVADGWAKGDPLIVYGMRREACPHLGKRAA